MILAIHLLRPSPIINALVSNIMASLEHIPRTAVLEKRIHLLEASACSFGIEEDDEGDAEDIQPKEEEERAVADGLEEERRDHGDDALPIDQPTTDQAPPFARTLSGKISVG